jgi:dipeptidyl aminopeptidase/acylaminoacyl peptidase
MFSALHRLGKTVELLRVPTENHGLLSGSPAYRLSVRQAILDWLDRFL